jgi:DNA-binding NarL/FixJ family response regulator
MSEARQRGQQVRDVATAVSEPEAVMHLLHVEDNAGDALLMQEYVRGVLPSVVFDTAVRRSELTPARADAADCALLDLSLPDASGLDALIMLRSMSEVLPIIVLTGFDNMELGLAAVRDGADDYLLKNHVDGYTLERAIQYAIERRRLVLQLVTSAASAAIATANAFVADAAAEMALRDGDQRVAEEQASVGRGSASVSSMAALGTHEVLVRIDEASGEFALSCQSCSWEADRGSDDVHSWVARSLDQVLLQHIDFSGLAREAVALSTYIEPSKPRRALARPHLWFG